ncbi:MAG TPA: methyltransferase [Gammaproteobacteria bacterium]|nr:methyltransferase [Gammaproteobacteria bacterium]
MKDELSYDQLVLIAGGHTAFQLLWAGIELGVFSFLSRRPRAGSAEIAEESQLQLQPARILLTGLTALKLIIKDDDSYTNSGLVEQLISPDSPENMADVLGWQRYIVYPGEVDFVASLQQGRNVGLSRFQGSEDTLYERLAHDPALEKIFQDSMSSLSRSANIMLANQVDFSGIHHLVDAGGGDGTNAITLAKAHPALKVTVFDSPSVCERAAANIEMAGLTDRVSTHSGNFFTDNFPGGSDCILFSHILTIWSREHNIELLKRAREALPDGGRVMIFNMMSNDAGDGPLVTALGSPYFLTIASGEGMMYSWMEYEEFLISAGFLQSERLELPKDHGVLVGIR